MDRVQRFPRSLVQANMVIGRQPGEVFVHRNVGNQASHLDLNCMSCLEYAVKVSWSLPAPVPRPT
ncbi:carbonate dehydratase, partial [Haematococcus lacustris]